MHVLRLIYFLSALVLKCYCEEEEEEVEYTLDYEIENFEDALMKTHNFVMFYAPWCNHCQRLYPTWEQLAEMLNEEGTQTKVAKIDCTMEKQLCTDQEITGYPTLKFYKMGDTEGVRFKGTRDLPTLTSFINEQLRGDDGLIVKRGPLHGLVELTDDNFEEETSTGKNFIKFYAPWCGHCQMLAPVWEQLARSFEHDSTITIAKMDCTIYKTICNTFEVRGYPTLLWVEHGSKVERYQGQRTHDELESFVYKMLASRETNKSKQSEPPTTVAPEADTGDLNADNFKNTIEKGVVIVKFFAPWCGHCKRLAPTWEDLRKSYVDSKVVKVAKVDCTLNENKELCNEEEVEGFPTIYLYKNGEKQDQYTGSRTLEDLRDFISKFSSSHDEL